MAGEQGLKKLAETTLLIGAGKGGVGKSTVTLNLAVELSLRGNRVGVLDADLYGPSLPIMMGLRSLSPKSSPDGKVIPIHKFGLHVVSLGFFIEEARPNLWRGPMLHSMLGKLIHEVEWPPLDFLLIDLPPGTGDIPLSLQKLLSLSGAIVITTPHEVAFLDVVKAVHAFDHLGVPMWGLIENLVGPPFGSSKGEEFAKRLSLPFLGSVPAEADISESADAGVPVTLSHKQKKYFTPLADKFSNAYLPSKRSAHEKSGIGIGP